MVYSTGMREPAELPLNEMIGHIGQHLFAFTDWSFTTRTSATMDTVAGQNWVALPADFDSPLSIEPPSSALQTFRWIPIERLNFLRSTPTSPSVLGYQGCVVWDHSGDVPAPRIEIWPNVTTGKVAAFTIYYKRKWPALSGDDDVVPVPDYCEAAIIALAKAWMHGTVESDVKSLDDRIAEWEQGPIIRAAMDRDGRNQYDLGMLSDGASAQAYGLDSTVPHEPRVLGPE